MAIEWELDEARRLLTVKVKGSFPSLEENIEFLGDLIDREKIGPGVRALVDLTDAEGAPGFDDARMFIASLRRRKEDVPAKRAYVVSTDLHYGVQNMTVVMAEQAGFRARVFRDREEALQWLLQDD